MKKNILITGAHSLIATPLREKHYSDNLVLCSRTKIKNLSSSELWIKVENFDSYRFADDLMSSREFDIIYHLAEITNSKKINKHNLISIHKSFLSYACKCSKLVIYPLTAYVYDDWKKKDPYTQVKLEIVRSFRNARGLYFPVIHPVIDSHFNLTKAIEIFEKYIPLNLFNKFNNGIYISSIKGISDNILPETGDQIYDIYDKHVSFSNLLSSEDKPNSRLISTIFYMIIKNVRISHNLKLINTGRKIDHAKIL